MRETRFEEMKRYVRLGADDAGALLAFRAVAAPHFVRIAREFYERIREHEGAHAVFTGEEQIERLQRSLVAWMHRILSGVYDEGYANETRKIGRVHVRVGLPQRYMFTAMALIRVALEAVAERELGAAAPAVRSALTRVLDLELAVMVDSHREDLEEQAHRRDQLAAEALRSDLVRMLRLYETALDVTPSLVVGLDHEGRIRLFNRQAQALTGHAVEDVIGAPFVDILVSAESRAQDRALIAGLLGGAPGKMPHDTVLQTRAGRLRDVSWQLTRTADQGPDGIALFAVGEDTTDAGVASRRARQDERLASLGTLAAGLAHEIRNPLNGAQLHVSYLRRALEKQNAEPHMLDAAAVVSDEIKRLAHLVSEFLDFARPSELVREPVVVQALIARAVELCSTAGKSEAITIEVDMPPQDLVVDADRARLEQVLVNIIRNAVEALTPAGVGHVLIRARRRPRDVVIEVEDDGPGLPGVDAPVFDAFFSTKPSGTGLGLAITHRIVTDHGGRIDVESRPGRTCFRLTVPIENQSSFATENMAS